MSFFTKLFRRKPEKQSRFFKSAVVNDLLADWIRQLRSINEDLSKGVLERLWARSMDLYQNNPHFRRYIQLMQQNVIGSNGFTLRVKVYPVAISQEEANAYGNRVRDAFLEWVSSADVDGNTWYQVQRCLNSSLAHCDRENHLLRDVKSMLWDFAKRIRWRQKPTARLMARVLERYVWYCLFEAIAS